MTVEANQSGRRSRLVYPALIFSLALNLLFIGGLATAVWHYYSRHTRGEFGLLAFSQKLPAEHRDAFRRQVIDARASLKDEREAVRNAWLDVNSLLTTEPFDKEKFKAAMAKLRETENQFRTGLNNSFAEIAASVTPEERKLLQAWRDKRRPNFLRRGDSAKADSDTKSD
ncbi:membrane-associated protein [Hyphomicrobium denitrificans 1NES1]|uniref:Membrane-associated protein n=1 Tax=Hyphomicrobium denitrificans 1NES1 TaxID=670307 RepID=N0B767_9HYPH|nr:periplasmic heavy metal sensor [Hyphomicrobium denitrificans]AGK58067.1 membrane-associated protein [Hyphomicrobium denitrificans 1NES1]